MCHAPGAGGWYVFAGRAFGEYRGFVTGCLDWTMQSVAMAYLAVAFGEFAAGLDPRLRIALILSGGFETLVAIASVLYVLVYMSGFGALLVLRRSEPGLARPYKVWCYPWSTLLVLAGSAAFFVAAVVGDLKNRRFALILVVCTYPLYARVVRNRARRVSLKLAELRDPAI